MVVTAVDNQYIKKGNAPSQQERWNCDEQNCPRSEGGNITYSTSEKRKTKNRHKLKVTKLTIFTH